MENTWNLDEALLLPDAGCVDGVGVLDFVAGGVSAGGIVGHVSFGGVIGHMSAGSVVGGAATDCILGLVEIGGIPGLVTGGGACCPVPIFDALGLVVGNGVAHAAVGGGGGGGGGGGFNFTSHHGLVL